jgi:TolB-like protein
VSEGSEDNAVQPVNADRMAQLWRRVKDHRIAQWTVGYVAVAYGIQHGVTLTSEAFDWPHSVERVTMLAFVLGLPLAVVFAWYHGERTTKRISRGELSIVSLLLVAIAILFYVFVRPAGEGAGSAVQANIAAQSPSALSARGISLAVLPFANMSGDAGQEFFSDGMTEEIMTALAKVPSLRVVGRESAFQFKGKSQDNRAVGKALGAAYLIEGSVRKFEDRVRITAQLVQSENGVSLWTETYDRELKDIFAVQEDVARAIATALRAPLGVSNGEILVSNRTDDLNAYLDYLQARALMRGRTGDYGVGLLESIVRRNPNYAPAWILLSRVYGLRLAADPRVRSGTVEEARRLYDLNQTKSEKALQQALRLDPRSGIAENRLGASQLRQRHWTTALDSLRQATELDPSDPDFLDAYSRIVANAGKLKESVQLRLKLSALEPFVPVYNIMTADILLASGQRKAAIELLEAVHPDGVIAYNRNVTLARAYAEEGRFADAADTLLSTPEPTQVPRAALVDSANLLQALAAKSKPANLPELNGEMTFIYGYFRAWDRMMEVAERRLALDQATPYFQFWSPFYAPLRKTERFKKYLRENGLVEYWRERGWPDSCRPITGTDDFSCE